MSELEKLNAELNELVRWRTDRVAEALRIVREVNAEFDDRAIDLHRRIKKLTPKSAEETPVTAVTRKRGRPRGAIDLSGMEDWTPEEIQHYKQLKGVA